VAIVIAAAVTVTLLSALLSGLAVVFLGGQSESGQPAVPLQLASTTPTRGPTKATPTPKPTTPKPSTPNPTTPARTASPTPSASLRSFAYQPLWPFASAADAAAWQRAYRSGGQQPWHLDADQTALSFTTGFLGFTAVNKVVSHTLRADDAQIAVGFQAGTGPTSVAAVLHLVRIGQGLDAPWEVVGTIDSTLTLARPRYGALAAPPLTVGGVITGVDEAIRVEIRQPSSNQPIGTYCCVAAGGDRHPWTAQVSFKGSTDPALTIVASTSGQLQAVQRFAITGVRSGR
jgi:hypothetical protein